MLEDTFGGLHARCDGHADFLWVVVLQLDLRFIIADDLFSSDLLLALCHAIFCEVILERRLHTDFGFLTPDHDLRAPAHEALD